MGSEGHLSTGRAVKRALIHLVPNGLSATRLVLGLVFPWLPPQWRLVAVGAAAVTDFLDGQVARWLRAESEFGRRLDPVADKVFVLILVVSLVAEGALAPGWAVAVVIRDLVVLCGVVFAIARRSPLSVRAMRPTWLGKWTTAAQFALLFVLVAAGEPWVWLLYLTVALSGLAAIDYAWRSRTSRP